MIICGQCGTRNPAETEFCVDCGAFLEWDGASSTGAPSAATAAGTAAGPADGPEAASGGPVATAPVSGAAVSGAAVSGAAVSGTAVSGAPVSGAPVSGAPVSPGPMAGAGPVPAQPGTTPSVMQPGEARRRYQVQLPDEPRPVAPGEVPCPSCGTGNDPSRRFCRSCGTSMARVVEASRLPWWRRLLNRLRRKRHHQAGTRRQARIRTGRLSRTLIALLVLLLAVVALSALPIGGFIGDAKTAIRDRVAKHLPVAPTAVRASSAASGDPAARAFDGTTNQFWAPAGQPASAWIEADLPQAVRLLDVIVTPGISTDKQQYLTQGRPHQLAVAVTTSSGKVVNSTLTIADEAGPQRFSVKVSDAVRIRFTIVSAYGMPPGQLCAIGELELFMRG